MLRRSVRNFWSANILGLITTPVVIAVLFYGCTAILGRHERILDIIEFVIAVAAGQLVSYKVMTLPEFGVTVARPLIIALIVMVAACSLSRISHQAGSYSRILTLPSTVSSTTTEITITTTIIGSGQRG